MQGSWFCASQVLNVGCLWAGPTALTFLNKGGKLPGVHDPLICLTLSSTGKMEFPPLWMPPVMGRWEGKSREQLIQHPAQSESLFDLSQDRDFTGFLGILFLYLILTVENFPYVLLEFPLHWLVTVISCADLCTFCTKSPDFLSL